MQIEGRSTLKVGCFERITELFLLVRFAGLQIPDNDQPATKVFAILFLPWEMQSLIMLLYEKA